MQDNKQRLIGPREFCARFDFRPGTLYSLIHRKQVPHIRLGPRTVRFDVAEIEQWLAERTVPVGK